MAFITNIINSIISLFSPIIAIFEPILTALGLTDLLTSLGINI
jgi:hypothetical protein